MNNGQVDYFTVRSAKEELPVARLKLSLLPCNVVLHSTLEGSTPIAVVECVPPILVRTSEPFLPLVKAHSPYSTPTVACIATTPLGLHSSTGMARGHKATPYQSASVQSVDAEKPGVLGHHLVCHVIVSLLPFVLLTSVH